MFLSSGYYALEHMPTGAYSGGWTRNMLQIQNNLLYIVRCLINLKINKYIIQKDGTINKDSWDTEEKDTTYTIVWKQSA